MQILLSVAVGAVGALFSVSFTVKLMRYKLFRIEPAFLAIAGFSAMSLFGFLNALGLFIYRVNSAVGNIAIRLGILALCSILPLTYLMSVYQRKTRASFLDIMAVVFLGWYAIERALNSEFSLRTEGGFAVRGSAWLYGRPEISVLLTAVSLLIVLISVVISGLKLIESVESKPLRRYLLAVTAGISLTFAGIIAVRVASAFIVRDGQFLMATAQALLMLAGASLLATAYLRHPVLLNLVVQRLYFGAVFTEEGIIYGIVVFDDRFREHADKLPSFVRAAMRFGQKVLGTGGLEEIRYEDMSVILTTFDDLIIALGTSNPLAIHRKAVREIFEKVKEFVSLEQELYRRRRRSSVDYLLLDVLQALRE